MLAQELRNLYDTNRNVKLVNGDQYNPFWKQTSTLLATCAKSLLVQYFGSPENVIMASQHEVRKELTVRRGLSQEIAEKMMKATLDYQLWDCDICGVAVDVRDCVKYQSKGFKANVADIYCETHGKCGGFFSLNVISQLFCRKCCNGTDDSGTEESDDEYLDKHDNDNSSYIENNSYTDNDNDKHNDEDKMNDI